MKKLLLIFVAFAAIGINCATVSCDTLGSSCMVDDKLGTCKSVQVGSLAELQCVADNLAKDYQGECSVNAPCQLEDGARGICVFGPGGSRPQCVPD